MTAIQGSRTSRNAAVAALLPICVLLAARAGGGSGTAANTSTAGAPRR